MKIVDIRNALIPKIKTFCNVPVIEADGNGPRPDGTHATYKFTTAFAKDNGRPVEVYSNGQMTFQDSYKVTISLNAFDLDDDVSRELAQQIYEWFEFYGLDDLKAANIAVVELSNITNRDAFVVENYERRNGFDVIIRVTRELTRVVDNIETVNTSGVTNF
jgi:hypothetical protein